MSEIIPELKLTYLEGSNPRDYAIYVKVDNQQAHPHLIISNENGIMVNLNTQFVIRVQMGESSEGKEKIRIPIGEVAFENELSQVKVQLIESNSIVGEEVILVKEAQQESRPIVGDL